MRREFALSLVVCMLASRPADAQQRMFNTYWQSLSSVPTVDAIASVPRPAVSSALADSLIAESLKELRAYELTLDRTHAFLGTRAAVRAVEIAPDNAWAHYALGATLARGPDLRSRAYAERQAYDVRDASAAAARAPRELRRALELDPLLDAAAFELGTLALDLGTPALVREAVEALDNPVRKDKGRALLFAAKLQNRLLSPERAYRYVLQANQVGVDASLAAHEQALSMFRFPEPNDSVAVATYLHGIDALTQEGAVAYFAAIALLVTPAEAKQWHSLDLEHKKVWLKHYWDRSAALAGTTITRRIAEHYARVARAEESFGVVMTGLPEDRRAPGLMEILLGGKPTVVEAHDQIVSLLRHGDPNRVIKYITCTPGWDTLPVPLQPKAPACMSSSYGQSRTGKNLTLTLWNQALKAATVGESFDPRYAHTLTLNTEAVQFRAAKGGAEVVGVVAIDSYSAGQLLQWAGELQPVLMITLVDTIQDWIRREKTTDRTSRGSYSKEWMTAFTVSTPAPAGRAVALRLGLENAHGTIGGVAKGTIDIESFDPAALGLSDIVMSPQDAIGSFKRGDVTVALAPGHVYTTEEEPVLYYEVYGIAKGSSVKTEVRIEPVRESTLDRMRAVLGRDDGAMAFSFKEDASASHPHFGLQQKRTIGLASLVPDQYRIRIIVTDEATGRSASRERIIQVVAPKAKGF